MWQDAPNAAVDSLPPSTIATAPYTGAASYKAPIGNPVIVCLTSWSIARAPQMDIDPTRVSYIQVAKLHDS